MDYLYDIGIQSTDGYLFKVHRNKLSKKSEYFLKLFQWNEQQDILIPGICGEIMSCIFNYIDTGKIRITVENVLQILMAADYFLVEELVRKCRRFIVFTLTVQNCVAAYNLALLMDRLKIETICYRFVQVHFEEIAREEIESFATLPLETLTTILSDACLNVSNEEILWKVVIKWAKKDLTKRLRYLPHLLLSIFADFSEKSKQELHVDFNFINLRRGPKVLENSFDFVKTEIVETIKLLNPNSFHVKIRQPEKLYFIIKLLFSPESRSEIYLTFDNNLDIHRKLSFCNGFFPNIVLMIDHIVYMFNSFLGENTAFDVLSQQWFSLPPSTRNRCSIVVLGKCIYALGGCIEDFTTEFSPPIAERYNPDLMCWEPIRPMRCNMVQAVAFDGFIYALGQYDIGSDRFMIFEKYDTWSNTWQSLPAPKISRRNFAFEVYKDTLFVLGGIKETSRCINSVEIYDPSTFVWSYGKRILYRYPALCCHILEDLLIVYDYSSNFPPTYWDGNEWKKYYKLSNPHRYLFYCIEDSDVIAKLWKQKAGQGNIWQQFIREKFS